MDEGPSDNEEKAARVTLNPIAVPEVVPGTALRPSRRGQFVRYWLCLDCCAYSTTSEHICMSTTDLGCLACPPEQRRVAVRRGMCNPCYLRACRLVKAGRTTWAELEAAGKAQPLAPARG